MINSTVIVGDRGVILVDTGASAEVGFPGATIISSEACRKLVHETGGEWRALLERDIGKPLPDTTPIAATVTYPAGSRTEVDIHAVRIVFRVPKGSHTAGDLMVYLPDEKVLVAGDILVNGVVPTFQDGFIANWIDTLDEIARSGAVMHVADVVTLRQSIRGFIRACATPTGRAWTNRRFAASSTFPRGKSWNATT